MTIAMEVEARCRCGARRYASENEAREVEHNGSLKCQTCYTFATDHTFSGWGEPGDERCTWDDIRSGSHR